LYTNQLSLTVTVSLTHQQITLLEFSNRRSFNCFHLTYAWQQLISLLKHDVEYAAFIKLPIFNA